MKDNETEQDNYAVLSTADLERLARFAGFVYEGWDSAYFWSATITDIAKFAELIMAAEREACAAVCELLDTGSYPINLGDEAADKAKRDCAALIRARSNANFSGERSESAAKPG